MAIDIEALIAAGALSSQPPPRPLAGGNADRRVISEAWVASTPAGDEVVVRLGPAAADRANRQKAFAGACPELVSSPKVLTPVDHSDLMAEPFHRGRTLESWLGDVTVNPAEVRHHLSTAWLALRGTSRPSTTAAFEEEWTRWEDELSTSGAFNPAEWGTLETKVLPSLRARLSPASPHCHWTNGDFLPANLISVSDGEIRLIDHEFSRRSHFAAEDAVRLRVMSPALRARPDLIPESIPHPPLAWHLFFWLRQTALEARHNTPAYLARWLPHRLAVIRRLSEHLIDEQTTGWSLPATAIDHGLELSRWESSPHHAARVGGWVHLPDSTEPGHVVLWADDIRLATAPLTPRPDVADHFHQRPSARQTGYELTVPALVPKSELSLVLVAPDGRHLPFVKLAAAELASRGPLMAGYAAWADQWDPTPTLPAPAAGPAEITFIIPAYNTPEPWLAACLASLRGQTDPRWQAVVMDDGSTQTEGIESCRAAFSSEARISWHRQTTNLGIAHATNQAMALATTPWVAMLDHDDQLRHHAVATLHAAIQAQPSATAFYTDEEKIDSAGQRVSVYFKPSFSPEFLRGVMYVGHLLCVRRAWATKLRFDPVFDGVQDYEFVLRLAENVEPDTIIHLPEVLYQWRQVPTSSALHPNIKGDMDALQAVAVQGHLKRLGQSRQAQPIGGHRVLVQPTGGDTPACLVVRWEPNQSVSALLPMVEESRANFVLCHEPATAPDAAALAALLDLARLPDSGPIAPTLLSSEGRVLESGWTLDGSAPHPIMRGYDPTGDGYHGTLRVHREVCLISPRCVVVPRTIWLATAQSQRDLTVTDFVARLCRESLGFGRYVRVSALARLDTTLSWRTVGDYAPSPCHLPIGPDRWFNPHFEPRGDYRLSPSAPPRRRLHPVVLHHVDLSPPRRSPDGCLMLRGWCHIVGRHLRRVTASLDGRAVPLRFGLARPDVEAALPAVTRGDVGYELSLRLPGGAYQIALWAEDETGHTFALATYACSVARWARGYFAWRTSPEHRLAFQFLPGATRRPGGPPHDQLKSMAEAGDLRVAIVTPSFQQGQFLEQAMRSVLSARASVDYVVCDGGSNDASKAIIERLAPRLHYWSSAPDEGQAAALVHGFARTAGEPTDLMAWLNADDVYLPGAIDWVTAYFSQNPHVDAIYGHRILIDENNREIGRWRLPPHDDEVLRLNDFVPQETLFWRRRLWDKVGGINPSYRFAMDWDLLLRFQAAGAMMVRVPQFLACFRVHADQKTSAQIQTVGQGEIDRLRQETWGYAMPPETLSRHPRLQRYLRHAARMELWAALGRRG